MKNENNENDNSEAEIARQLSERYVDETNFTANVQQD